MNKKAIYESVMRNVRQEVKKAIFESEAPKFYYLIDGVDTIKTLDDYEEGEDPATAEYNSFNPYIVGESVKDVVEKFKKTLKEVPADADPFIIEDGLLEFSVMVNDVDDPLSDKELELWKKGKMNAYSVVFTFSIKKVMDVSSQEFINAGYNEY